LAPSARGETPRQDPGSGINTRELREEQNRGSPRIEGVEYPVRPAVMLNPKLAHVAVTRADYPGRIRERQCRSVLDQQIDNTAHVSLLLVVQVEEPPGELVGALNLPPPLAEYAIQCLMRQGLYLDATRHLMAISGRPRAASLCHQSRARPIAARSTSTRPPAV
jgi:hypothetical protein